MTKIVKKDPAKKIAVAGVTGICIGITLIILGFINHSISTQIILSLIGAAIIFLSYTAWKLKSWDGIAEFISALPGFWWY